MRTKILRHTLAHATDHQAPLTPNDAWAAPTGISGIPDAVLESVEDYGMTVRIAGITGTNTHTGADIYLQIWSAPALTEDAEEITGYDLTKHDVLVAGEDYSTGPIKLLYSRRIFADLGFTIELKGLLEVYCGIIAVSTSENAFVTDTLSESLTVSVNVEIESHELNPSTYSPPTVDILAVA